MVFNSVAFIIFFLLTFIVYWLIGSKNKKLQNIFLLFASYVFYAWWDWRFLSLLIFHSTFSYWISTRISNTDNEKSKKSFLTFGIVLSILILGFFKYYNFFAENLNQLLFGIGFKSSLVTLNLILPLGISFFTFKILSYMLDVYRGTIKATTDLSEYLLFVSFFPQLVAGPIERATTLLPQIEKERTFNYNQAITGSKLIIWGLFKKVVIADTCAGYVADIFNNYHLYTASTLLLGTIYFAYQVYADFSGYSDIAIGVGKLLGFELMQNFDKPFISKNITEFWRRWHNSLSTWFNDYIFTPFFTRFRDYGNKAMYMGIILTFVLSGLWHGASWHYVFFGVLHGSAIVVETALKKKRKSVSKKIKPWLYNNLSMALTFSFVLITWIYFRANDMVHATNYLNRLFSASIIQMPGKLQYLPWIALLILWEYWQRKSEHPLVLKGIPTIIRWVIYITMVFTILYYFGQEQAFYYFQF
jgi:alginate O-acetyltransferase complex protein AlgI